jgi:hypothetical protein
MRAATHLFAKIVKIFLFEHSTNLLAQTIAYSANLLNRYHGYQRSLLETFH